MPHQGCSDAYQCPAAGLGWFMKQHKLAERSASSFLYWTQSCFCTEYSVDSVFWIKQGTRGKTVCCINTPTIKMHPGLILNVLWIAGVCLCCSVLLAIFLYTKCIHLSIPQKSVRSFIKQKRKITGVCFSLGKNETFQQLNAVFLILGNYIKLQ